MANLDQINTNAEDPKSKEGEAANSAATRLRDQARHTLPAIPLDTAQFQAQHPTLPSLSLIDTDRSVTGHDRPSTAAISAEAEAAKLGEPKGDQQHPESHSFLGGIWDGLFGKKPKETTDDKGSKTTDFGDGHSKVEAKDGTGYERWQAKDGSFHEKHFGPNKDDNYDVVGDKDGNKKSDWHNGHTKVENKDKTGYERTESADGKYTETHFGPGNDYSVVGDKNGKLTDFHNGHISYVSTDGKSGWDKITAKDGSSLASYYGPNDGDKYTVKDDGKGNKVTDWGNGHVKVENADKSGYEHVPGKDGTYTEKHWGANAIDNFTVAKEANGQTTTDWGNGHVRIDNMDGKNGVGYEHKQAPDGSYSERRWGPKPEDNQSIYHTAKGDTFTTYGDGHKKEEHADGSGNESWANKDGGTRENHWGKKPEDNYKLEQDKDGNSTYTFADGHTKFVDKNGAGYESSKSADGSTLEKHFGKDPKDNYTLTTDKDGNKKCDWGDGHVKVENADKTGYESTKNADGSTTEKHFGPTDKDNFTLSTDKDGNKKCDWGDGHVKVENADKTGYERSKNPDGTYTEKHFGPNEKDNFSQNVDKDGKPVAEHKLNAELEKDGHVRKGEGPWQVAERLLGKGASTEEIKALMNALRDEYRKGHPHDQSMRGLKKDEPLINNSNLSSILDRLGKSNPELRKKLEARLAS